MFIIACWQAEAIIIRHDIDAKLTEVGKDEFRSVLRLSLQDKLGIVTFEGTLIRSNWILTCAHFTEEGILPNQSLQIEGNTYEIDSIFLHYKYKGWDYDIALIRLKSDVAGIEPLKVFSGEVSSNQDINLVGTGSFGRGDTGAVTDDDIKRKATNQLYKVSPDWLFMRFDAPDSKYVTPLEGVSGPGNSGGPALMERKGNYFVIGVGSHSENSGRAEGTYGITDIFTNVSSPELNSWVEDVIKGIDFLSNEDSRNVVKLFQDANNENSPMPLAEPFAHYKARKAYGRAKKKLRNLSLRFIGMDDHLYAVYAGPSAAFEYRLMALMDGDSSISGMRVEKVKIDEKTEITNITPESLDNLSVWDLPENYVGIRIANFFEMCLDSSSGEAARFFVENHYEVFPGRENEAIAFFTKVADRINEIKDIKIIENKKDRSTIRFRSEGLIWTLGISINKTEPYMINGLTIDDGI